METYLVRWSGLVCATNHNPEAGAGHYFTEIADNEAKECSRHLIVIIGSSGLAGYTIEYNIRKCIVVMGSSCTIFHCRRNSGLWRLKPASDGDMTRQHHLHPM